MRALSVICPDLASEWNYARNPAELNPDTVSYSSSKKVWWLCAQGHEWQEKVGNRSHLGLKCPFCSGRRTTPENNLAAQFPKLAAQWHPTKNGALRPEQVRPKSNRKVWWQCERGHEWEAVIYSRTSGANCPYCAGRQVWEENCLAAVYPQIAQRWHPDKNGALTPRDVTAHTAREVWWRCEKGHVWRRRISYEVKAGGCPYCSGYLASEESSLAAVRPDLALEWHPSKNLPLTPGDLTVKSRQLVWWRCPKGHEWQMGIHTRVSGGGCPFCAGRCVCPENALSALSPQIAAQWHPDKNGALTPDQVTNHSSAKAWWRCEKGHVWQAVIRSRSILGAGCPVCAGKVASPDYNLLTEFPEIAEEWATRKNDRSPSTYLPFSNKKVWWKCRWCGEVWQARIIDRTKSGHGCPKCT